MSLRGGAARDGENIMERPQRSEQVVSRTYQHPTCHVYPRLRMYPPPPPIAGRAVSDCPAGLRPALCAGASRYVPPPPPPPTAGRAVSDCPAGLHPALCAGASRAGRPDAGRAGAADPPAGRRRLAHRTGRVRRPADSQRQRPADALRQHQVSGGTARGMRLGHSPLMMSVVTILCRISTVHGISTVGCWVDCMFLL